MAKVPQFTRQIFASRLQPSIPGAVQQQFQAGANVLKNVSNILNVQQQQRDVVNTAKFNSFAEVKMAQDFDEAKKDIAIQQDPELLNQRINTSVSSLRDSPEFKALGPAARRAANIRIASMQGKAQLQSLDFKNRQLFQNTIKDLDDTQDNYELLAVSTDTPLEGIGERFASAVRGSVSTGFIDVNKGEEIVTKGLQGIIEKRIDRKISEGNFNEATDIALSEESSAIFDTDQQIRLRDKILVSAEKADQKAAKEIEKQQAFNAFEMSTQIITGEDISVDEVSKAVRLGQISTDDGEKLQRMTLNPPAVEDDIYALAELNTKLVNGDLKISEVIDAASNNEISLPSQKKFIEALSSRIESNPAVKRARELIEAQYEQSFLGIRSLQDEQSLSEDLDGLYENALLGKENPLDIANRIVTSNKERQQQRRQSARESQMRRKLGKVTEENIRKLKEKILDDLRLGTKADSVANEELKILRTFEENLEDD